MAGCQGAVHGCLQCAWHNMPQIGMPEPDCEENRRLYGLKCIQPGTRRSVFPRINPGPSVTFFPDIQIAIGSRAFDWASCRNTVNVACVYRPEALSPGDETQSKIVISRAYNRPSLYRASVPCSLPGVFKSAFDVPRFRIPNLIQDNEIMHDTGTTQYGPELFGCLIRVSQCRHKRGQILFCEIIDPFIVGPGHAELLRAVQRQRCK